MTVTHYVSAPDTKDNELKALFENIQLIEKNKYLIIRTPEYYNINITGFGVFPLYVPSVKLHLGDMLILWEHTAWKQDDVYFYSMTGSPLSGSNSCRVWSEKKGFHHAESKTFRALLAPAYSVITTGCPNVDEKAPMAVTVQKKEPSKMTITELVEILKKEPLQSNWQLA
ncbi:MAG: hypothetical protein IJZ59_04955 [Alphaproteobacteria bacterium]|nr:hypothetical protein [Alphaproteobacteria bacterium]